MAGEIEGDASGPTTGRRSARSGRVQVVARMSNRRSWSLPDKLAILDEAFGANGSVGKTAERHEVGTGQIYTWRRQLLDGALGAPKPAPAFARVEVGDAAAPAALPPCSAPVAHEAARQPGSCLIEIELPSGVRVRVNGGVDAKALKRVLDAIGAR